MATTGFVYLLTNDAFPALVKVGRTDGSPMARAAQISASTGVPMPFYVYAYWRVDDSVEAERLSHEVMARSRVNPRREFFEMDAFVAYWELDVELAILGAEVVRSLELQRDEATMDHLIRSGHLITPTTGRSDMARMAA